MKKHAQTLAAALLLSAWAMAAGSGSIVMGGGGASSGWTYNGTQSLATGDAAIATNSCLYLNGATRTIGLCYDGTSVRIVGAALDAKLNAFAPLRVIFTG